MTSVQAELSSTRLTDESHSDGIAQDIHLPDVTSDSAFDEVSARIGGRFTADLAAILRNPPEPGAVKQLPQIQNCPDRDAYANRQFALACLHAGRPQQAKAFIRRHAPEQMRWLERQISCKNPEARTSPETVSDNCFLANITVVADQVKIDAEAGRIARVLGQFRVFRAWAYGHAADNGDGWIERKELETLWRHIGIAHSPRHARRLIKNGVTEGYWTQDRINKRIYLTGQVKVAAQLVRRAVETGEDIVGTNLPGRRRIAVSLAGSLQEASAKLYAAWFTSKDPRHKGTMISRETLCRLWQVSIPTLLTWERTARIDSQPNYAQTNDTAIDQVPPHAYLTLNRDGSYATAWRLPNTYTVSDQSFQQHDRTGKAKQVRRVVRDELAQAEQRGSTGDTASLRSDRRYFTDDAHCKATPYHTCENYLRKLGQRDGDLSQRRYFCIGRRYSVCIYEPYDIRNDMCKTNIHQRLIWQESQDEFIAAKASYRDLVENCLL